MKKLLKNELLLSFTVLSGLGGGFLYRRMMTAGLDEKGLLIPGNPITTALGVLCFAFLAAAFGVSFLQKSRCAFRTHFPPCKIRGCLAIAGGLITVVYGGKLGMQAQLLPGATAVAAGVCMACAGLCRFRDRQPSPMFHCIVCGFFIIRLVLSFRGWSADPQLQDYILQLMACISLMFFAFHRASCDANDIVPRRTAFFSLCAGFFCLASLSDPQMGLLFLGAGLWSVGAAPTLEPIAPQTDKDQQTDF